MGTPDFAAVSLERLYSDGYDVAGVFTRPDKPRERGMKIGLSPVKEIALSCGTPVYQPSTLKNEAALTALREMRCDLIATVAYGMLLPPEMLAIPPLGCINIHGSLLPKYRGAAPVQWAVLNGESETGVTSQYMDKALDTGDVILSAKTPIGEDETAAALYNRLSMMGAQLLSETLTTISRGEAVRKPQNDDQASYAPQLTKEMSPIDWAKTAAQIKCAVRGLTPWPTATATLGGTALKIHSVDIVDGKAGFSPGEIICADRNGVCVACADAAVLIKELQAPGGKRMLAADYLRGRPDQFK